MTSELQKLWQNRTSSICYQLGRGGSLASWCLMTFWRQTVISCLQSEDGNINNDINKFLILVLVDMGVHSSW